MSATTGVAPGTLRILIVDDETIVRDSLGAWFRQDGHRVDVAEGGKEALRMVSATRYDMAFLDFKMPGMDGLELQERLVAADPELSIVLMPSLPRGRPGPRRLSPRPPPAVAPAGGR